MFTEPLADQILPYINTHVNPNLSYLQVSEESVLNILKDLDPSKAVGPDGIPTVVLKECRNSLAPSITLMFNMFNQSLSAGIFPEAWKLAYVCPVYKKGSRQNVRNYRPIYIFTAGTE